MRGARLSIKMGRGDSGENLNMILLHVAATPAADGVKLPYRLDAEGRVAPRTCWSKIVIAGVSQKVDEKKRKSSVAFVLLSFLPQLTRRMRKKGRLFFSGERKGERQDTTCTTGPRVATRVTQEQFGMCINQKPGTSASS